MNQSLKITIYIRNGLVPGKRSVISETRTPLITITDTHCTAVLLGTFHSQLSEQWWSCWALKCNLSCRLMNSEDLDGCYWAMLGRCVCDAPYSLWVQPDDEPSQHFLLWCQSSVMKTAIFKMDVAPSFIYSLCCWWVSLWCLDVLTPPQPPSAPPN